MALRITFEIEDPGDGRLETLLDGKHVKGAVISVTIFPRNSRKEPGEPQSLGYYKVREVIAQQANSYMLRLQLPNK